jgi:predicted secreted protein with PEFG-CTERM motif
MHDGSSYTVSGKGASAAATAASIAPEQYVTVELEGDGEIELTLPKSMIDGVNAVRAGNQEIEFQTVSESSSSTTIRFAVPDGAGSVNIHGATVVPEFGVVTLLVLAASIVGVMAYTRSAKGGSSGITAGSSQA